MESTPSICFTCAQDTDSGTELNRLEDGRVCPTCAERMMEEMPSLLPGAAVTEVAEDEQVGAAHGPHLLVDPDSAEFEQA